MQRTSSSPPLPVTTRDKVAFLSRPDTYPEAPAEVEVIETHMSWVFLTERFVYKFKKARRFDHLDFSALQTRRRNCLKEIELNRRLAPDVYLGVLALRGTGPQALHFDARGPAVEWLVHMRRLPLHDMLDDAIRRGSVGEGDVRRFAGVLARFYLQARRARMSGERYAQRLAVLLTALAEELGKPVYALPSAQVRILTGALLRRLHEHAAAFEARPRNGRIVEAHGDLRPEHVCIGAAPVFIDCLEFDRDLRLLDCADELAFLALECERLGAAWIGKVVLDTYSDITGDRPDPQLVAFYKALRALVRARLAIWHTIDPTVGTPAIWHARARAYLDLATRYA